MAHSVQPALGPRPHGILEDALAILTGTSFVALGLAFDIRTALLTGGFPGLALLLDYVSGAGFWLIYFLLNLPFYGLAWRTMGGAFVARTFLAVCLECILTPLTLSAIDGTAINPTYASVLGGALIGVGLLMLFRHRTSLGGISLLALFLQQRVGLRAGYVQLGVDLAVVIAAAAVLPAGHLVLSIMGAVVTNAIIVLNHRPDRYVALA